MALNRHFAEKIIWPGELSLAMASCASWTNEILPRHKWS
jgi:hypothetical protein